MRYNRLVLFTDHFFLLYFFPVFITLYLLIFKRSIRLANYFIIAGSFIFYASFGIENLTILFIPMLFDFILGIAIFKNKNIYIKKLLLVIGIVISLGILAYFKYTHFLAVNLLALHNVEFLKSLSTTNIILPVGISFITFQRISYLVDIYRGKMLPSFDFVSYSTYASIFPHLISGPIVRFSKIKDQIEKRLLSSEHIFIGVKYFTIGLAVKVLLADKIFAVETNIVQNVANAGSIETLTLIFLFSLRIYLDFSGYSLIAVGIAKCMGFDFPMNFNSPYQAVSFQDFWRRWNITLSDWLRDYLYIPLGGNRKGNFNTYRNLIITFLLGGLWHGASWNFVLWGGLHGSYLAIERFLMNRSFRITTPVWTKKLFIFIVISLTWTTFLFRDLSDLKLIFHNLLFFHQYHVNPYLIKLLATTSPFILTAFIWSFFFGESTIGKIKPGIITAIVIVLLFLFVLSVDLNAGSVPFIYFQF